jgi:predicted O-linked N-acetylglucosamine transferase (SPINDLY family)
MTGHTANNRLLVFARKPAPVQVSYLGYTDTTGLTAMDYRVTDALMEPEGAEAYSSECVLRMPDCYLCYSPSAVAEEIPVQAPPALASGRVTFGSFNEYTKISDDQMRLWAKLLTAVPDSVLLLKVRLQGDMMRGNKLAIIQRFADAGIPRERLIIRNFARSLRDALSMYHEVDICLDSYPYNGATTTCESLWMGCPVIGLYGNDNILSRLSLSILSAVGLGELAVGDGERYCATAVRLARDLDRLVELRQTMRERMRRSPLMDPARFTRALEDHYRTIWRRWCEGDRVRHTVGSSAEERGM